MSNDADLPAFSEHISAVAWVAAEICRRSGIPLESPIAARVFDRVWDQSDEPEDEPEA